MKSFLTRVLKIYKPFRSPVLKIFLLMLLVEIVGLASPYLYGKIIDGIVTKSSIDYLMKLALLTLVVRGLIYSFLNNWKEKIEINSLDFDVSRYISRTTLERVLNFSIGQCVNQNSGLKQSVINKGEHSLSALAHTTVYEIFPLLIQVGVTAVALLDLNPSRGSLVLFVVAAYAGVSIWINSRIKDQIKNLDDLRHENGRRHTEILRNLALIQVNAQEAQVVREYDAHFESISNLSKEVWLKYNRFSWIRGMIVNITKFLVMILGIYYVHIGKFTPGFLVIFLTWSSSTFDRMGFIGSIHRRVTEMCASVSKYFELLDIEPDIKVVGQPIKKEFFGKIEFRNVSFKYPARLSREGVAAVEPELSNVSFILNAGQRVAFVGRSGAGKSTIIQLLVRAYDPQQGQILIDGDDLCFLDLKYFRKNIGIVPQDIGVFDRTLRYNITFGVNELAEDVTDEQLQEICRLSCIDQFQYRLEKGFDTRIGERGIKLSGGERQRVGIARALIKDPKFLIFDEATSNLDTENEGRIQKSIEQAARGRTTIVIAHRLSTVRNADKIFVVDKGRIVSEGTHLELENSCKIYQKLIRDQNIFRS